MEKDTRAFVGTIVLVGVGLLTMWAAEEINQSTLLKVGQCVSASDEYINGRSLSGEYHIVTEVDKETEKALLQSYIIDESGKIHSLDSPQWQKVVNLIRSQKFTLVECQKGVRVGKLIEGER